MAASNLNLGKASGGVLNVQPADGTTTTSLVLPAINGTVVAADSNGNVGIGTSSPSSFGKLAVTGAVGTVSVDSNGARLQFSRPGMNYIEATGAGSGLSFGTNGVDTNRVIIDSAGNVGIGTTVPEEKLDIRFPAFTGQNQTHRILVQSLSNSTANTLGSKTGITFNGRNTTFITAGGTSTASMYAVNEDNSIYSRNLGLAFYTSPMDSVEIERMRIDSSGRVTMPYQPSFRSYASSYNGSTGIFYNWATSNGQGSTYTYYRNIGGHFNTSTGTFTAPIAGRYLITAMYDNSTGSVERNIGWLFYNGSNIGEWVESYGQYDNSAGSIVLYLNANDTIQFGTHPSIPYSSIVAGIDLLG